MERLIKYDDVIKLLVEEGILQGPEIIEKIKPNHGSCCTCQDCGWHHDDCVCLSNELITKLKQLIIAESI